MRTIFTLRWKVVAFAASLLLAATLAAGQQAPVPSPRPNAGAPSPVVSELDRLQAAAAQANLDIGRLRIDKWKADGPSKQQAQANADSIRRNLTSALPGLIDAFRAAPQDLNAGFKLYRNLNALYDVFATFTESAGAFGPRGDYEELAQRLNVIDSIRRDLGDNLEQLTASNQAELNQLRTQVHTLQQQAATATPPKKVIVDDTEPPKKTTHKKKPATASGGGASGSSTPAPPSSKSQ
jgi:hypothetical protein